MNQEPQERRPRTGIVTRGDGSQEVIMFVPSEQAPSVFVAINPRDMSVVELDYGHDHIQFDDLPDGQSVEYRYRNNPHVQRARVANTPKERKTMPTPTPRHSSGKRKGWGAWLRGFATLLSIPLVVVLFVAGLRWAWSIG